VLLLVTTLAFGSWSHYDPHRGYRRREQSTIPEEDRLSGPRVIGIPATASKSSLLPPPLGVSRWQMSSPAPAHIAKREVYHRRRRWRRDFLAEIVASDSTTIGRPRPLGSNDGGACSREANSELSKVTWDRTARCSASAGLTAQHVIHRRPNLRAHKPAGRPSRSNVVAEDAAAGCCSAEDYQRVVAPFDCVLPSAIWISAAMVVKPMRPTARSCPIMQATL